MRYIIVEDFNGEVNIILNKYGKPYITENLEKAEKICKDTKGGYVIPLCDIVHLAKVLLDDEDMNTSIEVKFEMKQILGL